jgi:hypothetical protein
VADSLVRSERHFSSCSRFPRQLRALPLPFQITIHTHSFSSTLNNFCTAVGANLRVPRPLETKDNLRVPRPLETKDKGIRGEGGVVGKKAHTVYTVNDFPTTLFCSSSVGNVLDLPTAFVFINSTVKLATLEKNSLIQYTVVNTASTNNRSDTLVKVSLYKINAV